MTQDEVFLQAILEDLSDDTPWLVYADWLEERGDPRAHLYRHRRLTNSVGLQLVLVPPGKFLMGSPEDEADRQDREGPQHEVEITRPFYLGIYPVTQHEYQQVIGSNPSHFSPEGGGGDQVAGMDTPHFPVDNVSWKDGAKFCRRLSAVPEERRQGRRYRLPTEAEWEYACREGGRVLTPFYFGRTLSSAQANFDGGHPYGGAPAGPYLHRTTRVGSYPPNALGLYDLHGNLLEWCADWFDSDYYQHSPRRDPQGPPASPQRLRPVRGGPWSGNGHHCRAAIRGGYAPNTRDPYSGFRVACDIDLPS
jgi:uncharacterized protein (TIGR02996 family)